MSKRNKLIGFTKTTGGRAATPAEKQALETPYAFWSVIFAEFEPQIDVCATWANTKCPMWHGLQRDDTFRDALLPTSDWVWPSQGILRAWCNNPFGKSLPWHHKAFQEAQKDPGAVVLVLGLNGASQDWYAFAHTYASEIRLCRQRINYLLPEGVNNLGNSRDSALYIYRKKAQGTGPAKTILWDWHAAYARWESSLLAIMDEQINQPEAAGVPLAEGA